MRLAIDQQFELLGFQTIDKLAILTDNRDIRLDQLRCDPDDVGFLIRGLLLLLRISRRQYDEQEQRK